MKVSRPLGRSRTKQPKLPKLPSERDQTAPAPAAVPAAPRRVGRRAYADAVSHRVDTDTRGSQLLRLAQRFKTRRS
jgi:hypothetical protein